MNISTTIPGEKWGLIAVRRHAALGILTLAAVIPMLLAGCALSVEPVILESEAIFDSRLTGNWKQVDGYEWASITADGNQYWIEYTEGKGPSGGEKEEPRTFGGRLGRLGERMVLELSPVHDEETLDGGFLPGHLLFVIEIGAEEISIARIDRDVMLAALEQGELNLAYSTGRGGDDDNLLLLRSSSEELRSALQTWLQAPGVLAEKGVWRRVATEQPSATSRAAPPCFEASSWREADLLFRRNSHWIGADGASSVDLGGRRILWLFGDTWINPSGSGSRKGARMISNSVAIQRGTDPANSTIKFYWGAGAEGAPAAFLADRGEERIWLGTGVRAKDRLVLFFSRIRSSNSGLGFESAGWSAVLVENPDAEPSEWRLIPLETTSNVLGVVVAGAGLLTLDEYVYAFGSQDPVKSHPIFVVRWPVAAVREGNLSEGEWWTGDRLGWVPESSKVPRQPLFNHGQAELTLHLDPVSQHFLVVQTVGFGSADVALRSAPALNGPWTAPQILYRPPEYYRPNAMIYAAKAHPHLTGADLVLTYANNSFKFADHLEDEGIYYPRFVRLTRCE